MRRAPLPIPAFLPSASEPRRATLAPSPGAPALALFAVAVGGGAQIVIQSGALDVPIPGAVEDLPAIDRNAALEAYNDPLVDDNANLILALSGATMLGSSVATWARDDWKEGLTDLALFSETLVFNFSVNNAVKLAVRRPRPRAYANWYENVVDEDGNWDQNDPAYIAYRRDTEQGLSFYSMHTATVSSLWATATYIAFVRDYNPVEKWIIMGVGAVATISVAGERIASLDHFPTDVVAGGLAGIGMGVLVPHLHRNHNLRLGAQVADFGGGVVTLRAPWTW